MFDESNVPPRAEVLDDPGRFADALRGILDQADQADEAEAERLCEALVERIRNQGPGAYVTEAAIALDPLRHKHAFALLERTAAALLAMPEMDDPGLWRRYGQALVEQGRLLDAEVIFTQLRERQLDAERYGQAVGLLGRVYKQRYVDMTAKAGDQPPSPAARQMLQAAVDAYGLVEPNTSAWHAINLVAIYDRADADRVMVQPRHPRATALAAAASHAAANHGPVWQEAVALEVAVARGDARAAGLAAVDYVRHPEADVFNLESTTRQLKELWRLSDATELGRSVLPILEAELLYRRGGHITIAPDRWRSRPEEALAVADSVAQDVQSWNLERNYTDSTFVAIQFLERFVRRSPAVARLESEQGALGTGFVVDGEALSPRFASYGPVLVTNAHVVSEGSTYAQSLPPSAVQVNFTRAGAANEPPVAITSLLWSNDTLDVSICKLSTMPADVEPIPIGEPPPQPTRINESRVYVMGHPKGGLKLQVAIGDSRVVTIDPPRVEYRTATERGSSGSPVFDDECRVVAVHRGSPRGRKTNVGILLASVRQSLGNRLQ